MLYTNLFVFYHQALIIEVTWNRKGHKTMQTKIQQKNQQTENLLQTYEHILELKETICTEKNTLHILHNKINYIKSSRIWILFIAIWKIRDFLIPKNSLRRAIFCVQFHQAIKIIRHSSCFKKCTLVASVLTAQFFFKQKSQKTVYIYIYQKNRIGQIFERAIYKTNARYFKHSFFISNTQTNSSIKRMLSEIQEEFMLIQNTPFLVLNHSIFAGEKYLIENETIPGIAPKILDHAGNITYAGTINPYGISRAKIRSSESSLDHYHYQYVFPTNFCKELVFCRKTVWSKQKHSTAYYAPFFYAITLHSPIKRVKNNPTKNNIEILRIAHEKRQSLKKALIIVVDWKVPTYDQNAGSRSNYQYYKLLVEMGYLVKLIPSDFQKHSPYTEELQSLGIEIIYGKYGGQNWKKWITSIAHEIDYVYLNRQAVSIDYIYFFKKTTPAK